jgi:hypothetical protein
MLLSGLYELRGRSLRRVRATALVRSVLAGDIPREAYVNYLQDVHQYAKHSPVVIAMAGARATANIGVARYLINHATEELGHDVWAREDLEALGVADDQIRDARASHPCMSMIGMEYYWACHANPVALLALLSQNFSMDQVS